MNKNYDIYLSVVDIDLSQLYHEINDLDLDFWCFNATFSNISAISWRPVLVVEEAGVSGQATGKLYHLQLRVECSFYCNFQSRTLTHGEK
jgi:hypothetical protein